MQEGGIGRSVGVLADEDTGRIGGFLMPRVRETAEQLFEELVVAGIETQILERIDRCIEAMQIQLIRGFALVGNGLDDVDANLRRTQWPIGLGYMLFTTTVIVFGLLA